MEIRLSSQDKTQGVCPAIKIKYIGVCANLDCPANLARLLGGAQVGCYFKSHTASLLDFATLKNVDEKTIKTAYSGSITLLDKAVSLYSTLQELRAKTKWKWFCANCGAPQQGNFKTCLNTDKCNQRNRFVTKQKNREPLSLPGLNCTKSDIWLLCEKYDKTEIRQHFSFYLSERIYELAPPSLQKEIKID